MLAYRCMQNRRRKARPASNRGIFQGNFVTVGTTRFLCDTMRRAAETTKPRHPRVIHRYTAYNNAIFLSPLSQGNDPLRNPFVSRLRNVHHCVLAR